MKHVSLCTPMWRKYATVDGKPTSSLVVPNLPIALGWVVPSWQRQRRSTRGKGKVTRMVSGWSVSMCKTSHSSWTPSPGVYTLPYDLWWRFCHFGWMWTIPSSTSRFLCCVWLKRQTFVESILYACKVMLGTSNAPVIGSVSLPISLSIKDGPSTLHALAKEMSMLA